MTASGNVYAFGKGISAHGSLVSHHIHVTDIVGLALTADGAGYWLAGSKGAVYNFGDARALKLTVKAPDLPITGISEVPTSSPL